MPDLSEKIEAILGSLPRKPGIYLHKDAAGNVIYVGKASDLRQRVRSYFGDPSDLSPKNRALVTRIEDIEFIVVGSELEALILENEYIKRYQPKYNVRLRDDKNYPYIKVSLTEDFPRVYRVRNFRKDGDRYFGPYTSSGAVDATLDLMNKIFPYRTCRYDASGWAPPRGQEDGPTSDWKPKRLPRPCTQYYIHRCNAPCVGSASRAQYDAVIHQVVLFLEGKHDEVLRDLQVQMNEASEQLEFERAAALRDRINAVERVLEKQKIINTTGAGDQDVIAIAGQDDETSAQVFFFRGGRLTGRELFILQGTRDATEAEIIQMFLQQFYDSAPAAPGEIILSHQPEDAEGLREWLRQKRGAAVTITVPQRGDKLKLVNMVAQNAREAMDQQRIKWLSDSQKTSLALEELRDAFNLPAPPRRIECYDISNTQGSNSVGSMVVMENGKPKNSEYRRFRIKTVEGANDPASLAEVLRRRFVRLQTSLEAATGVESDDDTESDIATEDGALLEVESDPWASIPDLIMVDGGRPQLNATAAVIEELGVRAPIIGIAKENHGRISTYEEIYLIDRPEPLVLPRGSQGLYLLQRIRDEAHRFAITYHRNVRSAGTFRSVLDEIPGIGPKRKKALVRQFGSARVIASASVEDIAAIEGMNRELAERVKEFIGNGRAVSENE
ncbi:MAG TPA: excinuclease ABC subunit UvrC [Ktedonobacterales bacterium]